MREARRLLISAEGALSGGETSIAAKLFREIRDLYPGTMESIAALCYLRSARRRKQPRL